jgi:arsenate reductase
MAEGFLRAWAGDRFEAFSAGAEATEVRPLAIEAMAEIGIDISSQTSKKTDVFSGQTFEYVVTVCDDAKEACPYFPGAVRRLNWSFDDPSATMGSDADRLAVFRRVRDEIGVRIRSEFLASS